MTIEAISSDALEDETEQRPTPRPQSSPTSPLAAIKERIRKTREETYLDLDVPLEGEGPDVVVRYRAVSPEELAQSTKKRRKAPEESQGWLISGDVLATCCVGIYVRTDEGLVSLDMDHPDQPPPTFADERLDAILRIEADRALDRVEALYPGKGHVIGTSDKIVRWSGFLGEETDDRLRGS